MLHVHENGGRGDSVARDSVGYSRERFKGVIMREGKRREEGEGARMN